ncbi:CaiB/BaiF CoA transferase family protein [Hyphomonas chukchiensis]|uniref:Formyl-CoA transferase n=1 Tax=Hyphomonas chukchiensis TaxID=1280947 RepID=A0A062UPD6_9PROT|nr:CoA transferase [Hyphomonas chukchiensis]KCZ58708.1 hypothetical protein HY30_16000 [Hyphomonas chukchiensis]|tara:strand:+ start:11632 stop:12849 length:1218 start_codon:yes stop_codon:yes gene_type:complete
MATDKQNAKNLPLAGLRVIDLGQVYQGPYATFLMAKAGAEVIKVESPEGESARSRAEINEGAMLPFEMLNANKKGITLNLKTSRGRELFMQLVSDADVVLENFAPGVMDRLGIGWEVLRQVNPRLIYATATGYGISGRDRDGLAMDLTIQAVSGIMSVTGMPDGPPMKAGPAIADFLGGTHLYAGVMTALVERARTGHGRLVEVAMQETVFPTLASILGMFHGKDPSMSLRTGNRHSGLAIAPYNVYRSLDGYVAIICVKENHWRALANLMERPDLIDDPKFATNASRVCNMDETDALIEAWTSQQSMADLFEKTKSHKVPSAPVRTISEVLNDPHMHERGMLEWVDHPRLGRVVLPNSPLRFDETDKLETRFAPTLSEHTEEILNRLCGVSNAELMELKERGVV